MSKRILSLILCIILIFSTVGCTKAKDTQESSLLADTELEDSTDTTDSTVDKEQGTDTPTVTPPEGEPEEPIITCENGHTLDNWEITKSATCAESGKRVAVCSICSATVEAEISTTNLHSVTNGTTLLGAGITTNGKYSGICTVCEQSVICESAPLTQGLSASTSNDATELDLSDFSIIYDDTVRSNLFIATIKQLQGALNSATGLSIPLVAQTQSDASEGKPEILIGKTDRPISSEAQDEIAGDGFLIKAEDNKLIIVGTNELQSICAMQYFIYQLLPTHKGDTTLSIPTVKSENAKTVTLMSDAGSDFVAVYSKDVKDTKAHNYVSTTETDSTSDTRDYPCIAAFAVGDSLRALASLHEEYLTAVSSEDFSDSAILVGMMDNVYMEGIIASLDGNEYAIVVNNGQILLAAWNDYALKECLNEFVALVTLSQSADGKSWSLPALFFAKSTANESWQTDFPRPTGKDISLITTQSANKNALQFLYQGDGVTPEAYEKYCNELIADGFTLYQQNSIEQSLFRTYVNNEKGISLYVAYNAFAHKDEERYKDPDTHILSHNVTNKTHGNFTSEHPFRDYKACIRVISAPIADAYLIPRELFNKQSYEKIVESSITTMYLSGNAVGQCYIIQLEDGRLIVVDGGGNYEGAVDRLYTTLSALHKKAFGTEPSKESPIRIAAWYVTHSHADHYNAFYNMLKSHGKKGTDTIRIDYLVGNFPDRTAMYAVGASTVFMGSSKRLPEIQKMVTDGFDYLKVYAGQTFYIGNVMLEVLMTYTDFAPFTIDNSNDTNTVIRMHIGHKDNSATTTWLFPGDACIYQSRQLCVMYGDYLKSDIMHMAHHGNIGSEIALYETVDPTVLFFSHRLDAFFTYTKKYDPAKGWPHSVDYYVAHKLESIEYIYTGGHSDCEAVTLDFKSDGSLDYEGVYNCISGKAIAYSQSSDTVKPTTPAIKKSKAE